MPGTDGQFVRDSITRLANLFREMRYSDKPTESSLCSFSTDGTSVSPEAARIIHQAENWSLLLRTPQGQRDRNTKRIDNKYQINSMLSPGWDLPIYRRGVVALNTEEIDAIFDRKQARNFKDLARVRVDRMTAPRFGKNHKGQSKRTEGSEQPSLPGF